MKILRFHIILILHWNVWYNYLKSLLCRLGKERWSSPGEGTPFSCSNSHPRKHEYKKYYLDLHVVFRNIYVHTNIDGKRGHKLEGRRKEYIEAFRGKEGNGEALLLS